MNCILLIHCLNLDHTS